eukprot:gb/GEZN01000184.1/.p1 GENE.gb/GEZN01000184.1/~~gb/GEZN01000184.1/.p1  ORF type:complete len:1784 (+),score=165.74 gb/GEZN01000184.1/:455-5806(+)
MIMLLALVLVHTGVATHLPSYPAVQGCSELGSSLRVGVLEDSLMVVNTTFTTYLSSFLAPFGCPQTEVVPLTRQSLFLAIANGTAPHVNFVDPGVVSSMSHKFFDFQVLATLLRGTSGGGVTSQLAGTLVRKSSRHTTIMDWQDISSLALASNKLTLCAVDSFRGWHIQDLESRLRGSALSNIFNLRWVATDDQVLEDVFDELCDFGSMGGSSVERTSSTGSLATSRIIPSTDFFVVGEFNASSYPFNRSTDVYPEWAVISTSSLSDSVADIVKVALITMNEPALTSNVQGHHAGFTIAQDYSFMRPVEFDLDLFGDGSCPPGWQRQTSGSNLCELCPPGSYKSGLSDSCSLCLPSFYTDRSGAKLCTPCAAGYSSSFMGATFCRLKPSAHYDPILACDKYPNNTLVIGMLDDQEYSVEDQLWRWRPTFEVLFGEYMNQFNCFVKLQILPNNRSVWLEAVSKKTVAFTFTDSGIFSFLKYRENIEPMSTLQRVSMGHASLFNGGVIFRKRAVNTDLNNIGNINHAAKTRSLTACAVQGSFGGWLMQEYEFFKNKTDVLTLFSSISFLSSHLQVVAAVQAGTCDVGMVRASVLEKLEDRGIYAPGTFSTINQQFYSNFVSNVSTPLYSEWTFASLPQIEHQILDQIRLGLEVAVADDQATLLGQHLGFLSTNQDYENEQMLLYQLNLMDPSTKVCPSGFQRDSKQVLTPCTECIPGWFKGIKEVVCTVCVPGFYNNIHASSDCWHCPQGKVTIHYGDTDCLSDAGTLTYQEIEECRRFPDRTLKVGIMEESGRKAEALVQWRPTFEGVLNDYFNRYQCYFKVVVLDEQEFNEAIKSKSIDLAFTDSGTTATYRESDGIVAHSAVVRIYDSFVRKFFGGVMVRNAARNINVFSLQDVDKASKAKKLTFCAVSNTSLGGFLAQKFEFFKVRLDFDKIASKMIWTGGHRESVMRTMSGECDFGFAETETLERLVEEGTYGVFTFVVLSMQYAQGFLLRSSTSLYPEKTLSSLAHVPATLADQISIPLFALRNDDIAAIAGSHAGFMATHNLNKVDELRFQLGLAVNQTCGEGRFRNYKNVTLPICQPCPAGYASLNGVGACTICPVSYVTTTPGATSCTRCTFGTASIVQGGTMCKKYSNVLHLSTGAVYAIWVLCILLVLGCFIMFLLIIIYRETKLIKASSFIFNLLLVSACAVVCASTVLFTLEPERSNWVCSLRWWVPCIASSTIFGTLFSKTYRLHLIFRIFETKQKIPQSIKFKDMKVAALVSGFVAATSFILAIFFIVDPPFYKLLELHQDGQDYYTYVHACNASTVFVPLIFTCYVVLLCCQSYLAFRVRKLPTLFNESQLIAWLLYNTCFVGMVGVVVDVMLDGSQITPKMVVRAVALLLGASTPVCVLFFPKLAVIWQDQMNDMKYSAGGTGNTTGDGNTANHLSQNNQAISRNITNAKPIAKSSIVTAHRSGVGNTRSARSDMSQHTGIESEIYEVDDGFQIDFLVSSSIAGDEEEFAHFSEAEIGKHDQIIPPALEITNKSAEIVSKSTSLPTLPAQSPPRVGHARTESQGGQSRDSNSSHEGTGSDHGDLKFKPSHQDPAPHPEGRLKNIGSTLFRAIKSGSPSMVSRTIKPAGTGSPLMSSRSVVRGSPLQGSRSVRGSPLLASRSVKGVAPAPSSRAAPDLLRHADANLDVEFSPLSPLPGGLSGLSSSQRVLEDEALDQSPVFHLHTEHKAGSKQNSRPGSRYTSPHQATRELGGKGPGVGTASPLTSSPMLDITQNNEQGTRTSEDLLIA